MTEALHMPYTLAGRYRLERELGHGGMGSVYLAHDLKHGREVAVKVLAPHATQTLDAERFLAEVRTAAGLNHPHILTLHDSGEEDGRLYYVMPRVEGASLRDRLDRERRLPLVEAVEIARQAGEGLSYIHARGLVHRDIKPGNILIDPSGHAYIADFGLALALSSVSSTRRTVPGIALGSPLYMSPEQASGEADMDARSDVYSLGCVLFEMLAGSPPFQAREVRQVLNLHLTAAPPSLRAQRADVPRPLERIVGQALEKDPAARYPTAHVFAEALKYEALPLVGSARGDGAGRTARAAQPKSGAEAERAAGSRSKSEWQPHGGAGVVASLVRLGQGRPVKWLAAYLAAGWLLLQLGAAAHVAFSWPVAVVRVALLLFAAGALGLIAVPWLSRMWARPATPRSDARALTAASAGAILAAGAIVVSGWDGASIWTGGSASETVVPGLALLGTVVLAWYHGEHGQQRVTAVDFLIFSMLLLIAAAGIMLVAGGSPAGPAAPIAQNPEDVALRSVAVLPFVDMSPDSDQEYFSDGLSEELLNVLVNVPGVRVPARTSSFAFKGRNADVREIGRTLGVAHILEGSVRIDGDRFRVTAQLIDAETGYHLWSETYDRRLEDIFAVQEDIARSIVGALQLEFKEPRTTPLGLAGTVHTEAHQLYLRGLHLWNRRTAGDLRLAIDYFERAIRVDPKYAEAYVGLAQARLVLIDYDQRLGQEAVEEQVREAVRGALELNPRSAPAYAVLALLESVSLKPDRAEQAFARAIGLNPKHATTRQWYSQHLLGRMQFADALDQARIALELDPLSLIINNNLGLNYFYQARWDEAIEQYRATLELDPTFAPTRRNLAITLLASGRYHEALHIYAGFGEDLESSGHRVFEIAARALAAATTEAQLAALDSLRLREDVNPFHRARAYVLLGAHDEAVADLERFAFSGSPTIRLLAARPLLIPLHNHPRFLALLDRSGLPRPQVLAPRDRSRRSGRAMELNPDQPV